MPPRAWLTDQANLSVLGILVLFFTLCFFSVSGFRLDDLKHSGSAATEDEALHASEGYYYFRTGTYFLNPEHPPLVKDVAGLPFLFLHPHFPTLSDTLTLPNGVYYRHPYPFTGDVFPKNLALEDDQQDWVWVFLFNPQNDPDQLLFFARLSVILANTGLLLWLFHLLKKTTTPLVGVLGVFLVAVSQLTLGHAALVTMDVPAALLQILTLLAFSLFTTAYCAGGRVRSSFLLTALTLALANLTKFSSLLLFPALLVGGALAVFPHRKRPGFVLRFFSLVLGLFVLAGALLLGVYLAHTFRMTAAEITLQFRNLFPTDFSGQATILRLTAFGPLGRALAEYLLGLYMVFFQIADAPQTIFFHGRLFGPEGAGPLYFPVLFATKLALPFLALLFAALARFILTFPTVPLREKACAALARPAPLFLALYAYGYAVIALSSNFQIGLRHILPIVFVLALLAAMALAPLLASRWKFPLLALLGLQTLSVLMSFPSYLTYFNCLAGGAENGYRIATDSNYDWGQDVKRLGQWAKDHDVKTLYTDVFTDLPLPYYLGAAHQGYNILWNGLPAPGSYVAVSALPLQNNRFDPRTPPDRNYGLLVDDLVARIGDSIFVYRVPER